MVARIGSTTLATWQNLDEAAGYQSWGFKAPAHEGVAVTLRFTGAAGTHFQAVHPGGSYRSQWWVTGDDHGVVYGAGIHGQYLWVDPQAEVVVAKFGAHPEAISADALRHNAALMRWLVGRASD
jgi:CubicO group peptidase (beta-lactamase class C family)